MKIVNPTAKLGEDLACEYIKNHGYKILERNFRKGYGEIDIIAIDFSAGSKLNDQVLCFIEVKTRTSSSFGTPFEAINYWKLKTLIKTAQYYKMLHKNTPQGMRIDAVSVTLKNSGENVIEIIKNISGF